MQMCLGLDISVKIDAEHVAMFTNILSLILPLIISCDSQVHSFI